MPRQPAAESAEDRAIREIDDEDEKAIAGLAQQAGPPPDSERLSESDEDAAWDFTDPNVDYDDLASRLMTEGIQPQEMQQYLIFKLHPDWAPHYGQPTGDAEQAHQLARLAQTPFRASVLEDIDDPEEQVRKAESLDRRSQKRMTAVQEQMAQMPQPTMQGYGDMPQEGVANAGLIAGA